MKNPKQSWILASLMLAMTSTATAQFKLEVLPQNQIPNQQTTQDQQTSPQNQTTGQGTQTAGQDQTSQQSMTGYQQSTNSQNPTCYIYMGNLQFTQSTTNTVTTLITGAAQGHLATQNADFAPSVRAGVIKALNWVKRVRVKEESANESMSEFASHTPNECYIVDGTITNMSTETDLKDKSTNYQATVTFTLSMKNIKTNEVVASRQFESNGYSYYPATPGAALSNAMSNASTYVYKYFSAVFPLRGNVIEHGSASTNKQKELYIDLGSDIGIEKGQKLGVYVVQIIAGREAKTKVGDIKVVNVMGGDISLCKVTSGGSNIKAAFNKNARLLIITE